jgi:hypothetical protein
MDDQSDDMDDQSEQRFTFRERAKLKVCFTACLQANMQCHILAC